MGVCLCVISRMELRGGGLSAQVVLRVGARRSILSSYLRRLLGGSS